MSIAGKELMTAAFCWRLERRDGAAIGFTSHDSDVLVGGFRYRASPGMLPSAVTLTDRFEIDRLDVAGALTSDAIEADDLAAGRWDGAALTIFLVDWEDPEAPTIAIARGELGDISRRGQEFEAELRGPTALLERPVAELTSPECRAMLGDKRCRVDMAGRTRVTRIVRIDSEREIAVANHAPGSAYGYGRLRWLSGPNCGLESALAGSNGAVLTLREAPHFPAELGGLIEIAEGCDKSLATCSGRFANVANFRGEPHLPGTDLLTRYPGA
jgi:uncharacterized phage protein (TIGR02218 family)